MSEIEKMAIIENPVATLTKVLIDCAGTRTRAQIVNCHLKAEDHDGEYELTTNELDDAIEIMYKVETALGEALKNLLVAVGTDMA